LDLLLKIKDVGATACRAAPIFDFYSDSNKECSPRSTTPSSRSREGLGDEGATTRRAAPALENHPQLDGHSESFSGSNLGLTITSMPQGPFVYWKGFEPSELLDFESRLVSFTQELPFQEGRPLSPIVEEGKSSTELLDHSHTANHSPDCQVCMASLCYAEDDELDPSTTMNNSRISQPTSPQLMLPKMKMRSTEGSSRQRTPSALNTGATHRNAPV
jgi:hypothetical protein